MKIKEYDTDELLLIANNVTGEYTDKQVRQAKLELYNRGVDDKVITDIMEEKEEASCEGWMPPHVLRKPHGQTEREEQECQLPMVGNARHIYICTVLSVQAALSAKRLLPQTETAESRKV